MSGMNSRDLSANFTLVRIPSDRMIPPAAVTPWIAQTAAISLQTSSIRVTQSAVVWGGRPVEAAETANFSLGFPLLLPGRRSCPPKESHRNPYSSRSPFPSPLVSTGRCGSKLPYSACWHFATRPPRRELWHTGLEASLQKTHRVLRQYCPRSDVWLGIIRWVSGYRAR